MDGWGWPNLFPADFFQHRNKTYAELLGIGTKDGKVVEPEWEPGFNAGIFFQYNLYISLVYYSSLTVLSGRSDRVRKIAYTATVKALLHLCKRMTRSLQEELLRFLKSPDFSLADVPESLTELEAVKEHILQVVKSTNVVFDVTRDEKVCILLEWYSLDIT